MPPAPTEADPLRGPTRRQLLQRLLAILAIPGGAASLLGCRAPAARLDAVPATPSAAPLSAGVDSILEAASRSLLPSTEGTGAAETGVIDYLRRALRLPYYAAERRLLEAGARLLDAVARRDAGAPFPELNAAARDRVLAHVQSGAADSAECAGADFVHDLLMLCLEGFLGDPVHGGNRNEAGWNFIGYTPDGPRPGACAGPCR